MSVLQLVEQHDGRAVTTSLKVAEVFGKRHGHVIRDIRKLLGDPQVGGRPNFGLSSYVNEQNKEMPQYEMDRDGFTLLAMGFTGPKAIKFKLSYIDAFNKMEAVIKAGYIPQAGQRPEIEATEVFKRFNEIGRLIGFDANMAAFSANHATARISNVNVLELMGVARMIAPTQAPDFTPSQLGRQFNPPRSPDQVNEMLVQLGYQSRTRVKQCPYEATEKGKQFSRLHDTPRLHTAGTVQQLRWFGSILDQSDVRWATGRLAA